LFGPTVTANLGRSAVFAHALFGEARSSLGAGVGIPIIGGISTGLTSANAFAMAFGGGIDIALTRHLAIRAVQVDYVRTQFSATDALTTGLSSSLGNRQNSFRYSTGIVFRTKAGAAYVGCDTEVPGEVKRALPFPTVKTIVVITKVGISAKDCRSCSVLTAGRPGSADLGHEH
jgi:hypothetical protein